MAIPTSHMKLNELLVILKAAKQPEDVFGKLLLCPQDLNRMFRDLAKVVHPDLHKTKKAKAEAEEGFKLLNEWNVKAESKMKGSHWGDLTWMEPVKLATKKHTYTITRRLPGGDLANAYVGGNGTDPFVLKVCRSPANNDLLDNEREVLSYLWTDAKTHGLKAMAHIVKLHDSFELAAGPQRKRVVITHLASGYYNLASVKQAFPKGIDVRDSAWMFNRILGALLITQQAGVVHNAVLPEHVLVHPGKHNAKLCDWSYATRGKERVKAIVGARRDMYPVEVLSKRPTTTATDIYMAAKTILSITDPATMPRNIAGLLKTCLLSQGGRPQSVWELFNEFSAELVTAFGPRKFREFVMPTPCPALP